MSTPSYTTEYPRLKLMLFYTTIICIDWLMVVLIVLSYVCARKEYFIKCDLSTMAREPRPANLERFIFPFLSFFTFFFDFLSLDLKCCYPLPVLQHLLTYRINLNYTVSLQSTLQVAKDAPYQNVLSEHDADASMQRLVASL